MGERPFQPFPAESPQAEAARTTNAPTIAVDGIARFGILLPVPSPAFGFRNVAAHTGGFEIDERLVAVLPLVRPPPL